VDGRQPLVIGENGHGPKVTIDLESGAQRVVTPEQLFATNVSELLSEMYEVDPTLSTQFVLVPSLDDAFVDSVYPQPPFQDNGGGGSRDDILQLGSLGLREVEFAGRRGMNKAEIAKLGKRIHLASNPCTLHINDIVVGVTSTDILFQMSSEGCDDGLPPGSRLGRVAGHLVRQGSYYPLFPSAVGVPLDLTKSSQWEMPYKPDVLIVPSRLASFARPVGGDTALLGGVMKDPSSTTVAVNPGELTKGLAGGTYARIDIRSKKGRASVDSEAVAVSGVGGVQDRVSVEIRRI
jgi:DNA polymerase alpha subunit B